METPDSLNWKLTNDGEFSLKSAYASIKEPVIPSSPHIKSLWDSTVPIKVSFFMLRLIHYKIPLGLNLYRVGLVGPIVSPLCRSAGESVTHTFSRCKFSSQIWSIMGAELGITSHSQSFSWNLNNWWHSRTISEAQKFFLKITPSVICRSIWKVRNRVIVDDKQPDQTETVHEIFKTIKGITQLKFQNVPLCSLNWTGFWNTIMRITRNVNMYCYKWEPPDGMTVKINIASVKKGESFQSGGVVRNSSGKALMILPNLVCPLLETNLQAEIQSCIDGIQSCHDKGFHSIINELHQALRPNPPPRRHWKWRLEIQKIKDLSAYHHISKEANRIALLLAQHPTETPQSQTLLQKYLSSDSSGSPLITSKRGKGYHVSDHITFQRTGTAPLDAV